MRVVREGSPWLHAGVRLEVIEDFGTTVLVETTEGEKRWATKEWLEQHTYEQESEAHHVPVEAAEEPVETEDADMDRRRRFARSVVGSKVCVRGEEYIGLCIAADFFSRNKKKKKWWLTMADFRMVEADRVDVVMPL